LKSYRKEHWFNIHDYERWLEQLAPHEPVSQYLHNRTGEDSGDAHLKRQVMEREVVGAVTGGIILNPHDQLPDRLERQGKHLAKPNDYSQQQ